jgi:hypothetical protein
MRQAYYHLPYPYHVTIEPKDLSGDENSFVKDIELAIMELRNLLNDIHQSRKALPTQPFKLPKSNPSRITVVSIQRYPGSYAWLGWIESTSNRFQKLVDSAVGKIESKGSQLAPNAPNVLIVGLPIWIQSLAFANELVGPLLETNDGTQTNISAIHDMGRKIAERVSAFIFFQPADQNDLYPGWIDLVLNPSSTVPLPKSVEVILTKR